MDTGNRARRNKMTTIIQQYLIFASRSGPKRLLTCSRPNLPGPSAAYDDGARRASSSHGRRRAGGFFFPHARAVVSLLAQPSALDGRRARKEERKGTHPDGHG